MAEPSRDSLSRVQSVSTSKYSANYTYLAGSGSNMTTALVSGMEYAKVGTSGVFAPISFGYTYNAMGNITSASQTGEETVYYDNDAQGQLTRVTDDNGYWIYDLGVHEPQRGFRKSPGAAGAASGGLFCLWITEINGQSWKEKQQFF